MHIDRSLRGDTKKEKVIDELNFIKIIQLKRIQKRKFFADITDKQREFIIYPEFMVANHKITYQFIHNLKTNPNKVHDLTGEMNRSLKKQRLKKLSKCKYTKSHASLKIMVKQINME